MTSVNSRSARSAAGFREIALLLASLLVTLLLLEGALRIYHRVQSAQEQRSLPPVAQRAMIPSNDPELIYEWNPGWSEGDFAVNEHGMAGPSVAREKPEGTFRIAFVGDSVTAGFRLIPRDITYVSVMRAQLGRSVPIETLDFAVNGYALTQSARRLETGVLRFKPDLVVAQLCLNDPYPLPSAYARGPAPMSRLWNFVERRVAPGRFWASELVARNYDARGIAYVRGALTRIAAVQRDGPRVLLVLFPYLDPRAYADWDFAKYHAVYRDAAAQAGLPLLDLYEPFRDAGLLDATSPGADPLHPGRKGHALAAEKIIAELDRLGYLPK